MWHTCSTDCIFFISKLFYLGYKQQYIISELRKCDSSVVYDYNWNGKSIDLESDPWEPRWIWGFVGVDYFHGISEISLYSNCGKREFELLASLARINPNIYSIKISSKTIASEDLSFLSDMKAIRHLDFTGCKATGDFLYYLKDNKYTESLHLNGVIINDDHLWNIAHMDNLKSLSISGDLVTDRGLKFIENLSSIEYLEVDCPNITSNGILNLKSVKFNSLAYLSISNCNLMNLKFLNFCRNLRSLKLSHVSVFPGSFGEVQTLRDLIDLNVDNTNIKNTDIIELSNLQNLTLLSINNTKITDESIQAITLLKSIRVLQAKNTMISKAGLRRFEKSKKNVMVFK